MKSFAILALSAAALAVPLNRRDFVYETVVEEVYETVYTTTTVWVDPTPTASVAAFYEQHKSLSSVATSSAAPAAAPEIAPIAPIAAPVASSSVAPYIAPAAPATPVVPTTTVVPTTLVASTTPTVVAPAPSPPTYVPPAVATTTPAAAPSVPAAAPSTPSSGGQGDHTGDITYYDVSVGTGSCGTTASNSDLVVALSHLDMNNGANPNNNPLCGKMINIYYNGNVHSARVFDTCPVCAAGSLDLTQALFDAVAPGGDGRVHGVSWSFA
jgi:hypothetical protein